MSPRDADEDPCKCGCGNPANTAGAKDAPRNQAGVQGLHSASAQEDVLIDDLIQMARRKAKSRRDRWVSQRRARRA
eukprot:6928900-Lingulodinium_polyedra.AAC.1